MPPATRAHSSHPAQTPSRTSRACPRQKKPPRSSGRPRQSLNRRQSFFASSAMLIARAGHASTHLPHFEHSGMQRVCGSSCSGHTSTHAWQSMPFWRRQRVLSTFGFSVTFTFETSDTSAEMGQILPHHFSGTPLRKRGWRETR